MERDQKDSFEELKELIQSNSSKPILSAEEACQYLQLSKSTLYKLSMNRAIPFFKPGGKKLYFRRTELDEWVTKHRFATKAEIEDSDFLGSKQKSRRF